jgi:glucose-1-phosphate thymidylyltransferase
MKGIILAGGTGSRLFPSTKVTNKHLLPVYDKPMIYYPIDTLKKSGISEILIISSSEHAGDFMQLLGSGIDFDINFTYKIQDGAGGIAQALSLAENFAAGKSVAVILSDNIFEDSFSEEVFYFQKGANVFVKEVEDPTRFGVVELKADKTVRSIEEKPSFPKSKWAQTGFYLYDNQVFDLIRQIKPSARGELEITDVNNLYLAQNQLKACQVEGMWIDAGTHGSLLEASILAQEAFDSNRIKSRKTESVITSMQSQKSPLVNIGLLTYNSEKYLEACLNSLLAQNYENLEITILDNNSSDQTIEILEEKFPTIKLIKSRENLGFGKGHNEIIRNTNGEFYACLNIDMIFEPNFIAELVKTISQKPIYGSVGGKLKRWAFDDFLKNSDDRNAGKTNFIDSVGLKITKSHRFEDLGQGDVDYGQFDHEKEIFGVSGAAVLYRRKSLEDVGFKNQETGKTEYFDESMFMYKEDIDLAYRLQWAAWKSLYTPKAVAFHDRTISALGDGTFDLIKNRSNKPSRINKMSYLNHKILLAKNYSSDFSGDIQKATFWWNFKVFIYLLIFETETLGQWRHYRKLKKKIKQQKKAMPKRVSRTEIEKFIEI